MILKCFLNIKSQYRVSKVQFSQTKITYKWFQINTNVNYCYFIKAK